MKLIALGDNCIDYYHNTGETYPGGNAINVAVHAARQNVETEYLGAFADDDMAEIIKKALLENRVSYSNCPCIPGTTTKICSYDVVNGERSFVGVVEGEKWAGPIRLDRILLDYLTTADVIVSSCNAKIPEQIEKLAKMPGIFVFDFGEKLKYRVPEYYDQVCHKMDLALFSIESIGKETFRDFCAPLHERGVIHVLATMGSDGQMISNGREISKMVIHKVKACDTMGAGDSFLAGFVCELARQGWQKGQSMSIERLEKAMLCGQQVSALNCMNRGGFGSKENDPSINEFSRNG